MARYLTITNSRSPQRGFRRRTISRKVQTGPVALTIVTILLVCFISLLFLTQVFQTSTTGYQINELKDRAEDLRQENRQLEIKSAELRSMKNLEESAQKLNMVPPPDIVYQGPVDSSLAANR